MKLTVLNPGKRLTAEAVSNGNGRNCFMPSDVWTAGRVGRTRAGMRPFWHVLPVGGRAKATCWTAQRNAWAKSFQSASKQTFSLCVCLACIICIIVFLCTVKHPKCGICWFGYLAPAAQRPPKLTILTLAAVSSESWFKSGVKTFLAVGRESCNSSDSSEIPKICTLGGCFIYGTMDLESHNF